MKCTLSFEKIFFQTLGAGTDNTMSPPLKYSQLESMAQLFSINNFTPQASLYLLLHQKAVSLLQIPSKEPKKQSPSPILLFCREIPLTCLAKPKRPDNTSHCMMRNATLNVFLSTPVTMGQARLKSGSQCLSRHRERALKNKGKPPTGLREPQGHSW